MQEVLDSLKKNWFIYIFMGSVIVSWTQFSSRLRVIEIEVETQKAQIIQLQTQFSDVSRDIASIKTSIEFIAQALQK